MKSNLNFILINIYGPTNNTEKKLVWDEINYFIKFYQNDLILLGGYFNTILNLEEKRGGSQQISQSSKDFLKWCDYHNLLDIPFKNGNFTWNNKRKDFTYIAEKLDKFFIKGNLDESNLNIQTTILPIAGSDHFLVRTKFFEPHKPAKSLFKCEKMWFLDSNFLENIKVWWSQTNFEGSKMFIF